MSQEVSNIFRRNNKIDNIDDILIDIYDLILSKLNPKSEIKYIQTTYKN